MRTVLATLLSLTIVGLLVGTVPAHAAPTQPNVLIIITDDQPQGEMDAMPTVEEQIAGTGTTFTNGVIPTSLCCPSRSSLLTGNYSHTTGVYGNTVATHGAWQTFYDTGAETDTLATRLHDAGYHTALVGKYLNHFDDAPAGYIPPGWDSFATLKDGTYYNYDIYGTAPDDPHGDQPSDYSTDVLGEYAVRDIYTAPRDQPLFLYWAPRAPHEPFVPAPRDRGTWPLEPRSVLPGSINEKDMSDKSKWLRKLSPVKVSEQRRQFTLQHEMVSGVDDQVGRILDALERTGRLDNTLIVFLSDNGWLLGSHRLVGKNDPYAWSTDVPMMMSWPGHIPHQTIARLTPQIDLTASIAQAVGITDWTMDGTPALTTPRTGTVLEQTIGDRYSRPAYCGWRTNRYLFIQYSGNAGAELYDYRKDPDELNNVVDRHKYQGKVAKFTELARENCNPTPPGFTWPNG